MFQLTSCYSWSFIHTNVNCFLIYYCADSKTERRCCSTWYFVLPFGCTGFPLPSLFWGVKVLCSKCCINTYKFDVLWKFIDFSFSMLPFVLQLELFLRKKIGQLSSQLSIMILRMKYRFTYKGCSMLRLQHG